MPTLFEAPTRLAESEAKRANTKKISSMTSSSHLKSNKHNRVGPLTSYAVSPSGVRFETQEDTEEVILFMRQHLIVLLPSMILGIILIFAPFIIFPFFLKFLTLPITIPSNFIVVGTVFWYVFTFGLILVRFLRWYFNIYIVTNQRVVDIDFVHLLYKEFSEARLSKIQDVTYKTGGVFATFFNYGDVLVQTAAEMPNFDFIAVPNPEKVVQMIGELTEKTKT